MNHGAQESGFAWFSFATLRNSDGVARLAVVASTEQLLKIEGLKTYFHTFDGLVKAVDDVSFSVNRNETVALVGESGCGVGDWP